MNETAAISRKPGDMRLLIVDDEKAARYGMVKALRPEGYDTAEAEDAVSAFRLLQSGSFDLVITDVTMPGMNGIDFLRRMREQGLTMPVIVITAHGSEKLAVEAIKSGAFNYIAKPYDIEELRAMVAHAADHVRLARENERLKQELSSQQGYGEFVGESSAMRQVYDLIEKVSRNNVTVLIRGESGTGKELVARTIHQLSSRKAAPFVSLNCAALPRELIESELFGYEKGAFTGAVASRQGRFEVAHKGTIFLDEIGDMSLETQAKVLRILQERQFERVGGSESIEVDVRILSATHRDLQKEIKEGRFREDLYYRINVVEIMLPPLRDRNGDAALLVRHFLAHFAAKHGLPVARFSAEAMKILVDYHWPGNVRELINAVERCVVLSTGEEIGAALLPADLQPRPFAMPGVKETLENGPVHYQQIKQRVVRAFERDFLMEAMRLCEWNISQTALKLGMKRQFLQQKLKELDINVQEVRENT